MFSNHKPNACRGKGRKMPFFVFVTLTFELDLQTYPSEGPNTTSVWIWRKSFQRFRWYFIHKQKVPAPKNRTLRSSLSSDKYTLHMNSPSATSEPFVVSRANDIETERWLGDGSCSPAGDSGQSIAITNDGRVRTRAEIGAQLHKRIGMTDSAADDWLMTGRKKEQRRPFDVIWSRACWPE